MFRQRLNEMEPDSDKFMTRVWELPVVSDAYSQLSSVYCCVKERNRLFRFTLQTAENGVNAVVSRTVPTVVATFEKPISSLNTIACNQLDKLEHDYPIITKPSMEVLSETRQMCDNAVKPLVDRVSAVKQYGVDKVTNARSYTTEKIGNVKAYGMDKFNTVTDAGSRQVTRVLGTPLCHEVVKNVNTILGVADNFVDHWLPEGVDSGEPGYESPDPVISDESLRDHARVIGRAASLGGKVRRRMYARVASKLTNLQLRTKETVERLNFTVDLIEYSRASMTSAKNKAQYIWTEVCKTDEEVARELTEGVELSSQPRVFSNTTFERKAIATARHLTHKLKGLMNSLGVPADKLPTILQSQLERAQQLAQNLVDSVPSEITKDHELPRYAMANIRNYANLLLQTTSWMAEWTRQIPIVGRFMPAASASAAVSETEMDTKPSNAEPASPKSQPPASDDVSRSDDASKPDDDQPRDEHVDED